MTCRQCSAPLRQDQIRRGVVRCSRACVYAAQRYDWPERACDRCGTPLSYRQRKDGQRFCSHRCAKGRAPIVSVRGYAPCQAALAVLEANPHWWITYSDLAIWVYGDDRLRDVRAIRQLVYRMRQRGYRFAARQIGWPIPGRWETGLKLLAAPASREERIA